MSGSSAQGSEGTNAIFLAVVVFYKQGVIVGSHKKWYKNEFVLYVP